MAELKAMCEAAGFDCVRTYIASGNVVFASKLPEANIKAVLEDRLRAYAGKPVGVLVRTAREMADVLADNPFPEAPPNKVLVLFLDTPPEADAIEAVRHRSSEELKRGKRELYVHYPDGMGTSKLAIPAARTGTGRNINSVAKLAEMAAALEQ
jgi:uncharacterized protein (DUF1697 family)